MMRQYLEVRAGLPPNTLLLFRLGDFYELFGQDARDAASLLGLTLTQRNGEPMAGLPYHAADNYITRILAAGRKVAICDQVEAPQPGKIVRRALTRILTPGTACEDHQIEARQSHYLMALHPLPDGTHASWLDLSTGDFQVATESSPSQLLPVLTAIDPREILVPEEGWSRLRSEAHPDPATASLIRFVEERPHTPLADHQFSQEDGVARVKETLGVLTLEGFGLGDEHPALGPAGAVIQYASESLCSPPRNLQRIRLCRSDRTLLLDPATLRSLEIFRTPAGTRENTLIETLDGTVTAPGARLLESYLSAPTLDLGEIRRRHQVVAEFLEDPMAAAEVQEYLRCVRDLPRILGRLRNRIKSPRELGGIRDTLAQIPLLLQGLSGFPGLRVGELRQQVVDFPELRDLLDRALDTELPNTLAEGGYIRSGYDGELDRLRGLSRESKTWMSDLERSEQERTGIRNLRIRYNGAFGYYIEITKSNLHRVPEDYIRKQTTVNAERYYTPDLKEKEKEILHADEHANAREEWIFRSLVEQVLSEADALENCARALAEIDLLAGWASLARERDYCHPTLDDSDRLEIEQGRHPVVEQTLRRQRQGLAGSRAFVPNDTRLSSSEDQVAIITGPNMAGKSTYIRQVALIVLMAQIGSWVPARSCRVGLVDRIFSRVGASDELARGNSTFMVEMNETANILNNATKRSLIILDEIGRGTSTYDGLSIAWAVVEHLHGEAEAGPRTLFATHYHELTQIDRHCPRVRNHTVVVKEWNDTIVFVRQVVPGAADRSYGIQVARLAGIPPSVIARAKEVLAKLESDDSSHNLLRLRMKRSREAGAPPPEDQLELFFGQRTPTPSGEDKR